MFEFEMKGRIFPFNSGLLVKVLQQKNTVMAHGHLFLDESFKNCEAAHNPERKEGEQVQTKQIQMHLKINSKSCQISSHDQYHIFGFVKPQGLPQLPTKLVW